MAVIKQLKDNNQNIYPITAAESVRVGNTTLDEVINTVTKLKINNMGELDSHVKLEPQNIYVWSCMSTPSELVLDFPTIDSFTGHMNKIDEIMIEFYVPEGGISISTPDNIAWKQDVLPVFEPGYTYQIHFMPRHSTKRTKEVFWLAEVSSAYYVPYDMDAEYIYVKFRTEQPNQNVIICQTESVSVVKIDDNEDFTMSQDGSFNIVDPGEHTAILHVNGNLSGHLFEESDVYSVDFRGVDVEDPNKDWNGMFSNNQKIVEIWMDKPGLTEGAYNDFNVSNGVFYYNPEYDFTYERAQLSNWTFKPIK